MTVPDVEASAKRVTEQREGTDIVNADTQGQLIGVQSPKNTTPRLGEGDPELEMEVDKRHLPSSKESTILGVDKMFSEEMVNEVQPHHHSLLNGTTSLNSVNDSNVSKALVTRPCHLNPHPCQAISQKKRFKLYSLTQWAP